MQTLSAGRGGRWRQTDATMDVESLGDISVTSSVERQAMREQLEAVRHTLNSLASGAQPNASGVNGLATGGLDAVLSDIASKLTNIEGLYSSLTNKLEKVDLRMEDSERHIKDLQHFSASTIHETARLVDYVGARATPNTRTGSQAGAGPSGVSAGSAMRARHMAAAGLPTTPPPAAASPSRTAIEYVPGHMSSSIQQHAAQIHKLIAGLDFLEAHIIRQDQVVEGLQKQLVSVARDVASTSGAAGSRSPSELSLRMHDMSELLNKLRSHMYKVEKKSSSNEQALTVLNERIQAVELSVVTASGQQQREAGGLQSEHQAATGQSILELAAAQEELRDMVQGLCRDVLYLRDQLQVQTQQTNVPSPGLSAEDGAEMRRQLAYLMSQVPSLVMENTELKEFATRATTQISELFSALEQQQQQQVSRSGSVDPPPAPDTESRLPSDDAIANLSATVSAVQEQVANLDGRLLNAASREEVERLSAAVQAGQRPPPDVVAELASTVAALQGQVADIDKQLLEVVSHEEVGKLSAAVHALSAEQAQQGSAIEDAVAKVRPMAVAAPSAAVLAAEVAAAARANLEEQFGQLRHRIEVAAVAAEAAEAAARSSAESAAAAVALAESVDSAAQKASISAADLQENVLTMVAGVEKEQVAFKQQLALLAAQVSEEQGAISSGLLLVQEQVSAAVSAAMEAATCAQMVQEQQAASGQQERSSAETLQAVQAELREQVANVMERLKERVEQGMQQMDTQVSVLSEQLSGAIRAEEFDAALRDVRATAADSAERCELALASMDELRSELIVLTGQQDVVQSRIEGLEATVGVNPRSNSPLSNMSRASASGLDDGQDAEDGLSGTAEVHHTGRGARSLQTVANTGVGTSGVPASGGLLDLVAELRSRVGGLEGMVEAAAADMEQLRDQMHGQSLEAEETIRQATTQLIADLQGLSVVVDGMDERVASAAADCEAMAAASAATQQEVAEQTDTTTKLATRLEEVQVRLESEVVARVKETSAAVSSLSARIERDYINREQLGAIFQARADMKRAVDELASVFNTGRLLRTGSSDDNANPASGGTSTTEARGEGSSGALSPRLVSALEDLAGKQAELEHQVQLALYRTEGAVRQEQLAGIQQAMMTLELQFRRLSAASQQPQQPQPQALEDGAAGDVAAATATAIMALCARVEGLEAVLAAGVNKVLATPAMQVEEVVPCGSAVRVRLSHKDPVDSSTPLRLRLVVEAEGHDGAAAADPVTTTFSVEGGALSGRLEEASEPSLPQMPLEAVLPGSTAAEVQAALAMAEELQQLRRTVCDLEKLGEMLQYDAAAESTERQRLAEALADMQERLDMQVNATASTVAMIATMATDHQQHVRLQVRVGGHDAQDLLALAAAVSTLSARVDEAEDALASAFVVRTPRSPTRATAAAIATNTAAAGEESAVGDRVSEEHAAEEVPGEEDEEALRPALGLMVPVLPREIEQQMAALHAEHQRLEAALSAMGGRMDSLEAADALEEVRAAASEVVLDAIPGLVSQQVAVVREEMAAMVSRQGEELLALAGQAARDAAEAVLAVREAAAEAVAAREDATEGFAAQAAAAEAAVAAVEEAVAEASAAREAAVEAAAKAAEALEAAMEAMSARGAAREAQAAAEAAAGEAMEAVRTAEGAMAEAGISREAAVQAALDAAEAAGEARAEAAALSSSPTEGIKEETATADTSQAVLEMAIAAAREAAIETAMAVAREVAEDTGREAAEKAIAASEASPSVMRDEELTNSVLQLTTDVKSAQVVIGSLSERLNDADVLRDQLQALAAQVVAISAAAVDADAAANLTSSKMPPSTPTAAAVASIFTPAASAMVIPPVRTPRGSIVAGASPSASGARQAAVPSTSQQATFLARLVDVVKRQSSRLHAQYSDAEETGMALAQVDHTLEEAEAHLDDVLDANSPAFAETLVTVLEQVAALRYIGSQTHPAVQQMVLEHENRLEQMTDQLKALATSLPSDRAGSQPAAAGGLAMDVSSVSGRVTRLETVVGRVAGQQAALDQAVTEMLAAVDNVRHDATMAAASSSARDGDALEPRSDTVAGSAAGSAVAALEMAGLAAKVRLLDESLAMQLRGLRQELLTELAANGGSGGGADGSNAADMSALDSKVSQLHAAATAMRTRLLAVQEYVDSTQGMIKDMHVSLGGLHRRVDALEGTAGASGRSSRVSGSGSGLGVDQNGFRELQSDVIKFEGRLLAVESSSLEAAHQLAGLKGLAPRVTEAETRLADTSSKLAVALGGNSSSSATPVIPAVGPGMALPVVAGALRALELRVGGRLEATYTALDTLAGALSAAGKIHAESTANPFKAISAAVNNPVVVALDKKIESMRAEVLAAANTLLEDLRRDQHQQVENRLQSPDLSVGGRSSYGGGGGGGLSFRS